VTSSHSETFEPPVETDGTEAVDEVDDLSAVTVVMEPDGIVVVPVNP
jgi:hypothetical protein